jgi:hypothetical protein
MNTEVARVVPASIGVFSSLTLLTSSYHGKLELPPQFLPQVSFARYKLILELPREVREGALHCNFKVRGALALDQSEKICFIGGTHHIKEVVRC